MKAATAWVLMALVTIFSAGACSSEDKQAPCDLIQCTHGTCSEYRGLPSCQCDEGYAGVFCADCAEGYQDNDGDQICTPACAQGEPTCSGHGSCNDESGVPICECDPAYTGTDCATCGVDHQDHDGDGTCLPACSLPDVCGPQSICDDSSGQVICTCPPGYTGDDCSECESGFQDKDLDGSCLPDCASSELDCSGHGNCNDESGIAACLCEAAYAGPDCTACGVDHQDHDGDGVCLPACSLLGVCGPYSTCSDASGLAICICPAGHTGDDCRECEAGLQDNNLDGSCLPDCAAAALDCGQDGSCSDYSGFAHCDCPLGMSGDGCAECGAFFDDQGGVCVFEGVPLDPSFESLDIWQTAGGAVLETAAEGDRAPGRAYFGPQAVCDGASVSQTFSIPAPDPGRSHQLVFSTQISYCEDCSFFPPAHLDVSLQGRTIPAWALVSGSSWNRQGICLGAKAYAEPLLELAFQVRAPFFADCTDPTVDDVHTVAVDDVYLLTDGDDWCPPVGELLNPDFESGLIGWRQGWWGGRVEWMPSAGADASAGVTMSLNEGCGYTSLASVWSIPDTTDLPNPAVQLWLHASDSMELEFQSNGDAIGRITGTPHARMVRLCLPSWMSGMAFRSSFSLYGQSNCGPVSGINLHVDLFSFVNEPACISNKGLLDGGFEIDARVSGLGSSWSLDTPDVNPQSLVVIQHDPANAHSGEGVLLLKVANVCDSPYAYQNVLTDPAQVAAGQALRFWYRTDAIDQTSLDVYGPGVGHLSLGSSPIWTQAQYCLQPHEDLVTPVSFRLSTGGGSCINDIPIEQAWVDDVEIISDPTCAL